MGERPPRMQPVAPEVPEELVPVAPSEGVTSPSAPEAMAPEAPQELIPAKQDEVSVESSEEIAGWLREREEVVLTLRSKEKGSSALLKAGGSFRGELQVGVAPGGLLYLEDMNMGRVSEVTNEGNGIYAVQTEDGAVYELKKAVPEEQESVPEEAPAPIESSNVVEPFPTAEATREQFPDLPKEFEKVVITKTAIKEGQTSSVAAGAVYEGILLGDIAEGMSLSTTAVSTGAIERGGISQVGPGEFQIETGTSTYRIKKAS